MSKVLEVKPSAWKTSDGEDKMTYYVTLDDRTENVPAYDERAKDFVVGADLPEGWEVVKSKAGKDYLKAPGKATGGGRKGGWSESYRQGKEAFDLEQRSIHRAVAAKLALKTVATDAWRELANDIFAWLEDSAEGLILSPSPAPEAPSSGWGETVTATTPPPPASPSITSEGMDGSAAKVVGPGRGEGPDNPTIFAKLSEAYGSGPKALKAARVYYSDAPPTALSALSEAQIQELIGLVTA